MNSSLQCLSNVEELTKYMLNNLFLNDLNLSNKLGTGLKTNYKIYSKLYKKGGYLASEYSKLVKEVW